MSFFIEREQCIQTSCAAKCRPNNPRCDRKIVAIGGTLLIGSKLVPKLRAQGHQIVPASSSSGVRVHRWLSTCRTPRSGKDAAVLEFFVTSIRNPLTVEAAVAGVGHHVALSVVGSDRMTKVATFARWSLGRNSFAAAWRLVMIRGTLSPIRQRGTTAWR